MVGAYEVYADAIFKLENADGVFKITPWICKKASEITNNAIGSAYKALSYSLTPPTSAGWRYISSMGFDPAHPCANFPRGLLFGERDERRARMAGRRLPRERLVCRPRVRCLERRPRPRVVVHLGPRLWNGREQG